MAMSDTIEIGDRVQLLPPHPWSGCFGFVLSALEGYGPRSMLMSGYRVRLAAGSPAPEDHECHAAAGQLRKAESMIETRVIVRCDRCQAAEHELQFDGLGVQVSAEELDDDLRKLRWRTNGKRHECPTCVEDEQGNGAG